jgi:hypothetical protein
MRLREIAHSRTGDKGDTSNISVIAFDPKDYPLLAERVTAERVAAHFAAIATGPVRRYELPYDDTACHSQTTKSLQP